MPDEDFMSVSLSLPSKEAQKAFLEAARGHQHRDAGDGPNESRQNCQEESSSLKLSESRKTETDTSKRMLFG